MIIAPLGISPGDARFPRRGGRAYTHHSRRWSTPHRADPIAPRVSAPSCRPGGSRTRCHSGTPVCAAVGGPVSAAALEQPLRLAAPHRPPRGSKGRHRRRCALPVLLLPLSPTPPHRGSADRRRSCRFGGCAAPVTGPLRPVLPVCKRVECTAAGL